MVYPPQHYKDVVAPHKRSRRERWVVGVIGAGLAIIVAVTVIALTSHQGHSGHGCLDFNYTMATGGVEFHECGAAAKKICAHPPALSGLALDFLHKLPAQCHIAGLPYKTAS